MTALTLSLQELLAIELAPDYGEGSSGYGGSESGGRINNLGPSVTLYGPLATSLVESVAVEYLFAESGYGFDSYGGADYGGNQSNLTGPKLTLTPLIPKNEAFTTVDSAPFFTPGLNVNETINFAEAIKFAVVKALSEILAIEHIIGSGGYGSYEFGADEMAFIGPILSLLVSIPKSETFNTTDSIPVWNIFANPTETVNVNDAFTQLVSYIRNYAEILRVEYAPGIGAYGAEAYGDDASILQGPTLSLKPIIPKNEAFTIVDDIVKQVNLNKAETLALSILLDQAEIVFKLLLSESDTREYFGIQMTDKQMEDLRKYATMITEGSIDPREAVRFFFEVIDD